MEGDRDRLLTKGEKILMQHAYGYEIVKEGKKNVLYRVEFNRRVKLAADDDGHGMPQLTRMKALFETTKLPIRELRKTEKAILSKTYKYKGNNWASTGAPGPGRA